VIADLDTLLIALYVELTDRIVPSLGLARSGPGQRPEVTDAELACLAVANARTIWGRYFPGFTEHEQRLHSQAALRDAVSRTGGLTMVTAQTFQHPRTSTARRLQAQAEGRHYSTFSLYTPEELRASIATFLARLPSAEVCWVDEHLLVVARGSRHNQVEPDGPGSVAGRAI
jgi:hypothetical protein